MPIDWFTVSAQIVNFLILVWLMKRFLYKPILRAIDAREKRIANELADAASQQAEAQKEREAFAQKNETFDQERAGLLRKATDEVSVERQRLLEEARQAADALRAKRQDELVREQQSLDDALTGRTQEEVFAIARKALADLAGVGLEERICEVLARRLIDQNDEARDGLVKALKASGGPVLVRTAFELSPEQRATIQHALNVTFSTEMQIRFEVAPALISGIELTASGRKVAWSIQDYLLSIEASVSELLKKQVKPFTTSETSDKLESQTMPAASKEAK